MKANGNSEPVGKKRRNMFSKSGTNSNTYHQRRSAKKTIGVAKIVCCFDFKDYCSARALALNHAQNWIEKWVHALVAFWTHNFSAVFRSLFFMLSLFCARVRNRKCGHATQIVARIARFHPFSPPSLWMKMFHLKFYHSHYNSSTCLITGNGQRETAKSDFEFI